MIRRIIHIDTEKCNGCGACAAACHEGAIGMVDGKAVNELYCCALGDFKNWNRFLGISTDAWAASVGSDGAWTGAANYLGYPTFFKEHVIHRIAISSSGAPSAPVSM